MREYINLFEEKLEYQMISTLKPEQQQIALNAFAHLADSQRGKPEILATSTRANPGMFNAMGAFCYLAEHIGDLTHRMSQRHCEKMNYGYSMMVEKVNRGLRYFENGYGLKREIDGNLLNNFNYRREDNVHLQYGKYLEDFKAGAKAYADAHSALVVYNEAQWHARESAVSLGNLKYDALYEHLKVLRQHLEDQERWNAWASLVMMDDEMIKPYDR